MIHLLLLLFISIQAIGTTYSIADYGFLESKQPFLNQQKIIGASLQYNQVIINRWTMTHHYILIMLLRIKHHYFHHQKLIR